MSPMFLGFAALLVFFGGLRLLELVVSQRNWRRHQEERRERLREPLFVWMVLLHGSLFVVLPLEFFLGQPAFGGPLSMAAGVVLVVALVLRLWTLTTMGRSWNVRVVYGEDYPIVSNGPFRFIRHPNYLVVILELLALPLLFHLYLSAVWLTCLNAAVLFFRIRNEEAVLFQNPSWVAEMANKPRFFPRFR
ncbi:isoprenylcysteine carboxylmethyltransferase family protein [Acanthopleuribacter pedis]|uniref:Isoprenylcysteine carboxyl methyltransferase n=1 Tax=Acanthopleuribacter pedis TaxID=442870 RepID=A0A8J7QJ64_9BACT|nr:isoprenylcysteine carboxylmethyltransferase family protein [Acanthopleuribacter pedis]MBO1319178.1 hypothetical protein [Acanthopleuribacter pedis]